MKLRSKTITVFLAISLTGLGLLSVFTYLVAKNHLVAVRGEALHALAVERKKDLTQLYTAWRDRGRLIASRTQFRISLEKYLADGNNKHLQKMKKILNDALSSVPSIIKLSVCDRNNNLVLAVGPPVDRPVICPRFFDYQWSFLMSDYWMSADNEKLYARISGPIQLNGNKLGILNAYLEADEFLEIVKDYNGLGTTGETLFARRMADGGAQFLTPLRYHKNHALELKIPGHRVDVPIIQAINNRETFLESADIVDYRGVPVFAATAYVPELAWGIVAKLDQQDALKEADQLLYNSLLIGLGIALLVIVVARVFAGLITKPIVALAHTAERVKNGDHNERAEKISNDEVGILAQTFNDMLATLEEKKTLLEYTESRARNVINNVLDGIISIDEQGSILSFNHACEIMFGYTADQVVGQNVKVLMPEPHYDQHDQYLKNYKRTGKKNVVGIIREVQGKHANGSLFPLEFSVSEIFVQNQKVYTAVMRDISERKAMEQMKDDFVSTVNHELRTPLTSIQGALRLLKMMCSEKLEAKEQELLEISDRNCEHLGVLVNDILDMQKIASGKMEYYPEELQIGTLVADIVSQQQGFADKHGVVFTVDNRIDDIHCALDPTRFRQALINLLSNAAKFSPVDEQVLVTVEKKDGDTVRIAIQDHGPGIPLAFRDKIFSRFAQAENILTRSKGGTGLGLNITKSIIEALGGRIYFESSEGRGTTFFIELPIQHVQHRNSA